MQQRFSLHVVLLMPTCTALTGIVVPVMFFVIFAVVPRLNGEKVVLVCYI